MQRRKWDANQKAQVVLEGLRGRPLSEVCNEYGVSQAQYYKWRDVFLTNASEVFETANKDKEKERLKIEVSKLKNLVGELTVELKKNDW